jgi:hypothetical protein
MMTAIGFSKIGAIILEKLYREKGHRTDLREQGLRGFSIAYGPDRIVGRLLSSVCSGAK